MPLTGNPLCSSSFPHKADDFDDDDDDVDLICEVCSHGGCLSLHLAHVDRDRLTAGHNCSTPFAAAMAIAYRRTSSAVPGGFGVLFDRALHLSNGGLSVSLFSRYHLHTVVEVLLHAVVHGCCQRSPVRPCGHMASTVS